MSATDVLREHIGHRAVLRDERHLRCVDCDRTVVLPSPAAAPVAPTSTSSSPPGVHERCPYHLNGYRHYCVGCAADAKAAEPDTDRELRDWLARRDAWEQPPGAGPSLDLLADQEAELHDGPCCEETP